MQQLLHICSEHFDSKEKEEDKDKKDKKEKEKKESSADMGAHQVGKCGLGPMSQVQKLALGWSLSHLRDQSRRKTAPSSIACSPCPCGCRGCENLGLRVGAPCLVLMPVSLQGVAVLGIALIAMGEEIGAEMALRTFGHLVSDTGGQHRAGKRPRNRDWVLPHVSVDLILGLTLTSPLCSCGTGSPPSAVPCPWPLRLSRSPTPGSTSSTPSASSPMTLTLRSPTTPSLPWAWWAVVSLGDSPVWGSCWGEGGRLELCTLLSACTPSSPGTNNARLAAMLRQLAQYHAKDPNNLFMVRLAQVTILRSPLMVGKGQVGVPALGVGGQQCPRGVTLLLGRSGGPRCLPHRYLMCFLCHTRA